MNDVMQGRWTLLHVIGLVVWQKHVKSLSLSLGRFTTKIACSPAKGRVMTEGLRRGDVSNPQHLGRPPGDEAKGPRQPISLHATAGVVSTTPKELPAAHIQLPHRSAVEQIGTRSAQEAP